MRDKRWLGIVGLLVAVLTLGVALAACGGDDEDGGEPTATVEATEEATATEEAAETPEATETEEAQTTEPADSGATTTLDVILSEFSVEPVLDSAPAGMVTFEVRNDGGTLHNLLVIRSDAALGQLPMNEDEFVVDEDEVEVVGSLDTLDEGDSDELTVDLEAGRYVLICNVPTHYESGMEVEFTVE
jgi:uncharacterized cupredoxin-like copper-binding protein